MDSFEKLKEVKQLLDQGIITEEEYERLKTSLLEEIDNSNSIRTDSIVASRSNPVVTREVPVRSTNPTQSASLEDGATTGMKVLSFLIPIAGLILFFMDREKKPAAAKEELMWAAIGFGVGIVLSVIMVMVSASGDSYYY